MALAKCADCGRDVSTEAAACPNCGRPTTAAAAPAPAIVQASQPTPQQQPAISTQTPSIQKNWFVRHKALTAILTVFVLIIIAAAAAGNKKNVSAPSTSTTHRHHHHRHHRHQHSGSTAKQPKPNPKPKPSLTGPQQQAIQSAQNYLSEDQGFSQTGLIHQLSSKYGDGFPTAVATFAVGYLNVNWYEQAVLAAKAYKSTGGGFSCSGMIQQLSSSYGSGFTHAQAVYGADHAGVC
jgi:hypothetical protein